MSILDTAGAVVFFLVTLILILVSRRLCAEADTSTVTIHDYSIRVERLPQDAGAEELIEFFGQYGEVIHVELVRAYGALLGLVMRRGQLLRGLKRAVAQLQREAEAAPEVGAALEVEAAKIGDTLGTITRKIRDEQAHAETRRTVAAFVTFREEAGKAACLAAQPRSYMRQWLALKPQHKLRGCHALKISDAPEPSDVKYENIEHDAVDRAARRLLTSFLQYLSLAAGFVLISMASAMRFNQAEIAGVDTARCSAECDYMDASGLLAISPAKRELYGVCAATGYRPNGGGACTAAEVECYKCFCYEALSGGMINEAPYCIGQAGLLVLQYSAQALNVLGILLINMVLVWSSRWLTLFEKHHTRSDEARSLAQKLFFSQFLNSALSTIIANAHLPGLSKLIAGTQVQKIFFQGIYTDLTPNWYKTVGTSIVTSQFVATAVRFANVLAAWLLMKWRMWRRSACLTQEELQETLRGPAFELDARYGQHLNVIYVALLISGGIPIAYASAAVWFAAAYWYEKWELLKLSRRPVAYGGALSSSINHMVPFATVFHFAFALWAYSFFGTSTSRLLTPGFSQLMLAITAKLEPVWRDASGLPPGLAAHRLVSASGLHLLAALVVVAGILVIKIMITAWAKGGRSLLSLVGLIADSEDQQISGAPEFAIALRTQLLVGGSTYAIQAQPEYQAAFARPDEDSQEGDGVEVQVALQSTKRKGAAAPGAHTPDGARVSPRAPARRSSSSGGSGGGGSEREHEGAPGSWERRRHGAEAAPDPNIQIIRQGSSRVGEQRQAQRQDTPLTGAQRFRRARAGQVIPVEEESAPDGELQGFGGVGGISGRHGGRLRRSGSGSVSRRGGGA